MKANLTSADFAAFFTNVYGYRPFPWQQRLAKQVIHDGSWPSLIDLPTGSGKTAVVDVAVFALAVRPDVFPRRIVFVIDRRIVVDQVYRRAERLHDRLEEGSTAVLRGVHERLRAVSGGEALGVAALRGGVPVDTGWAHTPDRPWVIVSTVDQFGSRLLFRGYGVHPRMRPVHAGLAGNDCLVILDEVHLSRPFAETLANVGKLPIGTLPKRFQVVEMSATPTNADAKRFGLDPSTDLDECPELRRRIKATKTAALERVQNHDKMVPCIIRLVKSVSLGGGKHRQPSAPASDGETVGVVVNRVRVARDTYRAVTEAGFAAHLLTGRMRPIDKIDALKSVAAAVDPDRTDASNGTTVVVATQAIEVGADFSFDVLITECAPIDSLRQRFGRLDRRGTAVERRGVPARSWIIGPKSVVGSKTPDPIYGRSVKATWQELSRRHKAGEVLEVGPLGMADFPPDSFAPRLQAPLLLQTHMEAWVQTSPEPVVQPSIDWFLHGIDLDQQPSPDVSVVWRQDRSSEALRLMPPRSAELLQVPIAAVRAWLAGNREIDVADSGRNSFLDTSTPTDKSVTNRRGREWVRWNGFKKGTDSDLDVTDIVPGDVIVVDPAFGGLSAGTWDPNSNEPVDDLGDAAQLVAGRKATLRLDRALLDFCDVEALPSPRHDADSSTSPRDRIEGWLAKQRLVTDNRQPRWFLKAIERFAEHSYDIRTVGLGDDLGSGYYVLVQRQSRTVGPVVEYEIMDGSDESCSLTGTGIQLEDHLKGVAVRVSKFAARLGFVEATVGDLILAGRLHDIGKVDSRFQEQLVGGDPIVALQQRKQPLAKSKPGAARVQRYPTGMRHELASLALIESNRSVFDSAHDPDLVLHLVASHHGYSRPLPSIEPDSDPQQLRYSVNGHFLQASSDLGRHLALQVADRFWRLVDRYGFYGLAWLEAIFRLADHRQSSYEDRMVKGVAG